MTENPRPPVASIHIESRECSPELLERLTGATYFPERLLGATIVNTVLRGGGHVLYVTAPLIIDADQQVDYYVSLLSGSENGTSGERRDARERVQLVSLDDVSSRWLSEKVLDPASEQAAAAREVLRDFVKVHRSAGAHARLSYFEPSRPLESLARDLGVPGTQSSSIHIPRGSKHSSREIFAATGIPVAPGTGLCHNVAELAAETATLVQAGHRRILLKLNSTAYGGGLGNALLEVGEDAVRMSSDALADLVLEILPQATLVDSKISWDDFVGLLEESGVIAEAWIEGGQVCSPSFQGRLTEEGGVEAISTHDQVFGEKGQSYTGCTFPAHVDYRSVLVDYGLRVGRALLELGVDSGEYGVDFLALRSEGDWRLWGCEINLRATATKHPFTMATGLLGVAPTHDGRLVVEGTEYVYQASDGILAPHYRGLRPAQLIEAVTDSPLAYDPERRTGVVLHLMSSVLHHGKFGALCIGTDHAEAAELMRRLRELADTLASGSRTDTTIPHSQSAPSAPHPNPHTVVDAH